MFLTRNGDSQVEDWQLILMNIPNLYLVASSKKTGNKTIDHTTIVTGMVTKNCTSDQSIELEFSFNVKVS